MNLVMVSIFLLAMLAFQPTLIYGTKGLTSTVARKNGDGKKHSASAKLKLSLKNGDDILVRSSRGTSDDVQPIAPPAASESGTANVNAPASTSSSSSSATSNVGAGGGHAGSKRGRNNNRKTNKNISTEIVSSSNGGRKHLDKKYSAAANQEQQQQLLDHLNQHQYLQRQHQHGADNNRNKQRQFLKSQQHQHQQPHSKRSGIKAKTAAADDDKATNGEKPTQSTCRYAKSPWSDCDSKTNMRTRTLTLKKGEEHCLPTRTMQKKCKKQCRYDKGSWSECISGQMTRQDKLKATGNIVTDATCEAVRSINRKCNPNGSGVAKQHQHQHQLGAGNRSGSSSKERKNKNKAARRSTLPPKAA